MIFVTVGTHKNMNFDRLLRKLDEIAPKIKEKIIIQKGCSKYLIKNCENFEFTDSIDKYYKKARLVIMHGGSSVWEFAYKYQKPLIIVPRLKKYNEHYNDHQVEFADFFSKKTGVKVIYNIDELTPTLLKNYKTIASIDKKNLVRMQDFLKKTISCLYEMS